MKNKLQLETCQNENSINNNPPNFYNSGKLFIF